MILELNQSEVAVMKIVLHAFYNGSKLTVIDLAKREEKEPLNRSNRNLQEFAISNMRASKDLLSKLGEHDHETE